MPNEPKVLILNGADGIPAIDLPVAGIDPSITRKWKAEDGADLTAYRLATKIGTHTVHTSLI